MKLWLRRSVRFHPVQTTVGKALATPNWIVKPSVSLTEGFFVDVIGPSESAAQLGMPEPSRT
ncbi:MAG: hypothetical protein KDA47_08335, partial [Planctomycetales bacterium]|nr:hypothetical protein [Planctomycetales bacterium]